jgi:hypothetical protein
MILVVWWAESGSPPFGLGHLGREVLDGVNAAHENVAQRLAAGVGILERLDRRGDGLVRASVATACTRVMASWRPLTVETAGSRSGFCWRSQAESASS